MILDAFLLFNKVTIQYVYDKVLSRERITYQAGMYMDQAFSTFASTSVYKDPLSLLRRVHIVDDVGAVVISGNFPDNWIKSSDVETLINLVQNKSKCACLLDPLSSFIPFDSVAEVGGYAIQWIKAFKEKRNYSFSLYTCPKVNTSEADSLIRWWYSMIHPKDKISGLLLLDPYRNDNNFDLFYECLDTSKTLEQNTLSLNKRIGLLITVYGSANK